MDNEMWLSFDCGEWAYTRLGEAAIADVHEVVARMAILACGHWRVGVGNIPSDSSVSRRYLVMIEGGIPVGLDGEEDGPAAIQDQILVRDTPSLLQLLALLRSADIEYKPPER